MQTRKTGRQLGELKSEVENLTAEIERMKKVLPRVKQFGARQTIGGLIKGYQATIQGLRREIFEMTF